MNIFINVRYTLAINVLLILLSAFLLNSFLNYQSYTLEKNGNWDSVKTELKGVNGVYANIFTKVALCKNQLNIAAWFGYQELIYRKPVRLGSLYFKYHSSGYPYSLIIHKSDSLTYGIYFHYKKDSTCCLFVADREGKFLFKRNFNTGTTQIPAMWNNIVLKRSYDFLDLNINGQNCLHALFKIPTTVNFGFRGGAYPVFIDDVKIYDTNGELVVEENFTPPFQLNWLPVIFTFLFLLLLFSLYQSSYKFLLTAFNMSALIGFIVCYLLYYFHFSFLYPVNADYINWHGKTVTFDFEDTVCARLRNQFTETPLKPIILFIGSSQTWGAGKSDSKHSYPALVEKNLRNYFHDSTITAINAGICGATSDILYKHYAEEWYKLHPTLTVINLSHNDHDSVVFRKYIRNFLEFNQLKNIRTILIAEPNDHTYEGLIANHRAMQEEGKRFNLQSVSMQDYMNSADETGFIWWDWVHMTDYGYRLFAERITPFLIKELERDSMLIKFNSSKALHTYKAGRSHSP